MSKEIFRESVEGILPIEQKQVERAVDEAIAARIGFPVPKTEEEREELVAERPIGGAAQGWLVNNVADLATLSPKLRQKLTVYDRTPDTFLKPQRLEEIYFDIVGMVDGKKVTDVDVAPYLARITERLEGKRGTVEFGKGDYKIKIEDPETPKGWTRTILTALNELEEKAEGSQKRFDEKEYEERVSAITAAIDAIPFKKDEGSSKDKTLAIFLKKEKNIPVTLKEKLKVAIEARRRLHNRKIEMGEAGGSLAQLGVGERGQLSKSILTGLTDIERVHFYVLFHFDDLFAKEVDGDKELAPPIAEALNIWREVGEKRREIVVGGISFYDGLRDPEEWLPLRAAIAQRVGSAKGEAIAHDISLVGASFSRWDPEHVRRARDEIRDLIHWEHKRRRDFLEEKNAGPFDTVGAYFAKSHQGEIDTSGKKDPDYDKEPEGPVQKKRTDILRANRDIAAFIHSLHEEPKGELVGDLWESIVVPDPRDPGKDSEEKKKVSLLSIIKDLNWGWKKIPFLAIPEGPNKEGFYRTYFEFFLAMAMKNKTEFENVSFNKPEETTQVEFWQERTKDMGFLSSFSPYLNTLPKPEQAEKLEELKIRYALGVLWIGSHRAKAEKGIVGGLMRTEVGDFTYHQVRDIYRTIERSGFLSKKYLGRLKTLVSARGRDYNFSMGDARTGQSSQWEYTFVKWGT